MRTIRTIAVAVCLLTGFAKSGLAQSAANLAVKAVRVSASVNNDNASLVNDNLTGATSYWSSYSTDERLGGYEYVELLWDRHDQFTEIRAYWATAGDHILLPSEAYI
ncbi:MAG: hypothetical protein ACSW8D_13340, partial [Prevotella sp.]